MASSRPTAGSTPRSTAASTHHWQPELPPDVPPFPASDAGIDADDLDSVYGQLVKGVGHEFVNDRNVDELARRAEEDGHPILATELREWKAPC
ncbi:hypothetical protein [Roseateles sp. MS654]|uniref:hypothetical protein n=1 Tax=Roseateles sp. MS654 TaxID=3412685 RepID=UPI003C2E2548